jgi:hypothetical protein
VRKLTLFIALALLAVATADAGGYDLTATCPRDGETAYFSDAKDTPNGESCNYQHTHYDTETRQNVTHSYWIPCTH